MKKNRFNAGETSQDPSKTDRPLDQVGRIRELEAENARLKQTVAILTVDKLILKEDAEKHGRGAA